jgi:hypothetical protein
MLAMREYPDVSINEALDLLIDTNSLSGMEILLLEAGTEVVIYI